MRAAKIVWVFLIAGFCAGMVEATPNGSPVAGRKREASLRNSLLMEEVSPDMPRRRTGVRRVQALADEELAIDEPRGYGSSPDSTSGSFGGVDSVEPQVGTDDDDDDTLTEGEYTVARRLLNEVESGNVAAVLELAVFLMEEEVACESREQSMQEAFDWVQRAFYRSEKGSQLQSEALAWMGWMHYQGMGVPENKTKGYEILTSPCSLACLRGRAYAAICRCEQGDSLASEAFRVLAEEIDPLVRECDRVGAELKALLIENSVWGCRNRQGEDIRNAELVPLYLTLRHSEIPYASWRLYKLYATDGYGVMQNIPLALKYLEEAAEKGYAPAQLELARGYDSGRYLVKDGEKAIEWLERAVRQGDAEAQYRMGVYKMSQGDAREAISLFEKAISQMHVGAKVEWALAYFRGTEGIERNQDNNWRMVDFLIEGCTVGQQGAACALGQIYWEGHWGGVEKNESTAAFYFRKAFEEGDPRVTEQWVKHVESCAQLRSHVWHAFMGAHQRGALNGAVGGSPSEGCAAQLVTHGEKLFGCPAVSGFVVRGLPID